METAKSFVNYGPEGAAAQLGPGSLLATELQSLLLQLQLRLSSHVQILISLPAPVSGNRALQTQVSHSFLLLSEH